MFSSRSLLFAVLVVLLGLSQTVQGSIGYSPPVNPNGDGQVNDRLLQNSTYTFRWIGLVNATLSTETRVPQPGTVYTTRETIATNITWLGVGTEVWNWTHTVTEPLDSNFTVMINNYQSDGMSATFLIVEEDRGNSSLGRPTFGLWAVAIIALVISVLMV